MTLSTFDAKSVLASEESVSSQLPSAEVDLGVEPDVVCLGNLLLVESNPRDEDVGNDADKLRDIARDNAQGYNSIDIFFGPVSIPEPVPSDVLSFEIHINLMCPSPQVFPELAAEVIPDRLPKL